MTAAMTCRSRVVAAMILILLAGRAGADEFAQARAAYEVEDFDAAARLFAPLADEGNEFAETYLGMLHQTGGGVPKDFEKAAGLYARAARRGDVQAQLLLGCLYRDGR